MEWLGAWFGAFQKSLCGGFTSFPRFEVFLILHSKSNSNTTKTLKVKRAEERFQRFIIRNTVFNLGLAEETLWTVCETLVTVFHE
jgi:hypothetical protein